MFQTIRRKFGKKKVLDECIKAASELNRDESDFIFQNAVRECMNERGYRYVGKGENYDATDPSSYSS